MLLKSIKNCRFLRTLLYRFNNLNMHKKIMLTYFLFAFLLIVSMAAAIYTTTASSIRKQNIFSLQQNFNQTNSYLSYKLDTILSSADFLIYNASLNSILNKNLDIYSIVEQNSDAQTLLYLLKNVEENVDINQVRIYVPDQLIYANNGINICSFSEAQDAPWQESLSSQKGKYLFFSYSASDKTDSAHNCISLLRTMYRQDNYALISFILQLDIPLDSLESILQSANYTTDSVTCLVDSSGNIVASSSSSDAPHVWTVGNSLPLPEFAPGEVTTFSINNIKYIGIRCPLLNTDWNMVTLVPHASFTMTFSYPIRITICCMVVTLLLAWFLTKPIAYTITKRIKTLCTYMQKNRLGTLVEVPGTIYRDEIGMLYESYNFMISEIHRLMNENQTMERELKSAEYEALQSQINPHFLYNTLDMISWLSYQNKSAEISSVVYSLANFYKLSLAKGKYNIPLSDEIRHVTHYMEIQKLRFYGNIDFIINVDQMLLQFSIPKITLQPIVENAILHGILETASGKGTIILSGTMTDGCVLLTLADDGIGMDAAQLASILKPFSDKQPTKNSGSHYGLNNIDRRIKILYGPSYGLSFESTPGKGTKVHILLPAVHVDEL